MSDRQPVDLTEKSAVAASFCRRSGLDGYGMNIRFKQCGQGLVNQLMAFQCRKPGKHIGNDVNAEMSPTIAGAGMPGMFMAVVLDSEP